MIARIIRDMELTFFDNNKEDLVLSKKVQGESVNRGKFLLFPISRLVSFRLTESRLENLSVESVSIALFETLLPAETEMRKCF